MKRVEIIVGLYDKKGFCIEDHNPVSILIERKLTLAEKKLAWCEVKTELFPVLKNLLTKAEEADS